MPDIQNQAFLQRLFLSGSLTRKFHLKSLPTVRDIVFILESITEIDIYG